MLFTSIILMTLGYTMVYSALHGRWQFWTYFFPSQPVSPTETTVTPATAAA